MLPSRPVMEGTPAPASILVVRLGAVGDVIRTLPAVSCLRRSYPRARIGWAVEEPSREILEGHPDIDEVFVLSRRTLKAGLTPAGAGPAATHVRGYLHALHESGFEWAVDFQGTLKSALIARRSGARRVFGLGRGHAREYAHLLYTDPVAIPPDHGGMEGSVIPQARMSRTARALRLVSALGADISAPRVALPVWEEAATTARRFLDNAAPGRPRVLIFPGTSEAQAFKRYPAALFARMADGIVDGFSSTGGGTVIIGWGPGERPIAEEVVRSMRRAGLLAPPTRLRELGEILRQCDLFIGSDTGPMHLAAAVGVPIVSLYGPTDPEVNAPYTEAPHLSFVGDVTCRPCRNRGCQNRSCLRLIDPEMVSRRAVELLPACGPGVLKAPSASPISLDQGPGRGATSS